MHCMKQIGVGSAYEECMKKTQENRWVSLFVIKGIWQNKWAA